MRFRLFILLLLLLSLKRIQAQQNNSLYFVYDIQQSNLLNPAVPVSCKWYVGIPVLSSIHENYANSSFAYNDIFTKNTGKAFQINMVNASKNLHWRNYIATEIHIQLFALGYKWKNYSFMFTVTEKNNFPLTIPKDPIILALEGNAQFTGEKVGLKGTGVYFNHYREFAVGVSKKNKNNAYFGIKAKLLFGKLNISTASTDIGIYTDPTSFNLEFGGKILVHSSLPLTAIASNNRLTDLYYNEAVSPINLALNRKNPGIAFDAGIILPISNKVTFSASVIDLGLIRWRSNLNTFEVSGNFNYTGFSSSTSSDYFNNLGRAFLDSMNFRVYPQKYTTFLPPRFMSGINYKLNRKLSGSLIGNAILYKTKFIPSVTLSGIFNPITNIGLMASYTIQNYSFNSIGAGFYFGKSPVQFYAVSDNIMAVFKPLDARNVNVRFGINLNIGCSKKEKTTANVKSGNNVCFGYADKHQKKYLKKFKPCKSRK